MVVQYSTPRMEVRLSVYPSFYARAVSAYRQGRTKAVTAAQRQYLWHARARTRKKKALSLRNDARDPEFAASPAVRCARITADVNESPYLPARSRSGHRT